MIISTMNTLFTYFYICERLCNRPLTSIPPSHKYSKRMINMWQKNVKSINHRISPSAIRLVFVCYPLAIRSGFSPQGSVYMYMRKQFNYIQESPLASFKTRRRLNRRQVSVKLILRHVLFYISLVRDGDINGRIDRRRCRRC